MTRETRPKYPEGDIYVFEELNLSAEALTLVLFFAVIIAAALKRLKLTIALGGFCSISFGIWTYLDQVATKAAYAVMAVRETTKTPDEQMVSSNSVAWAHITGQMPTSTYSSMPQWASADDHVLNVFFYTGGALLVLALVLCLARVGSRANTQ